MKKVSFLSAITLAFTLSTSFGTSNLQFSIAFGGKIAANFANATDNTGTNGMNWGVIVSTTDNVFNAGSYQAFSIASGTFLNSGGAATDDYFFPAALATSDTSALPESAGTGNGGPGTIGTLSALPYTNGISTGDKFALVWFSTNSANTGNNYGFFTDASFVIPSDGSTTDFSGVFSGVDPVRKANLTIASAVPEPTATGYLALAGLTAISRRRRGIAK